MQWNTVTWYSKLFAALLFGVTFFLGSYVGYTYQQLKNEDLVREKDEQLTNTHLMGAREALTQLQLRDQETASLEVNATKVDLITPIGGEVLCIGETIPIKWRAGEAVDSVRVLVWEFGNGFLLGDYRATHNETGTLGVGEIDWKVGTIDRRAGTMPQGDLYKISLEGRSNSGGKIMGATSNYFSLVVCEG